MPGHYLTPLFAPGSVAVVGASERPGSLGRLVFANLIEAGFQGEVHAVNPRHTTLLGRPCHASLTAIGRPVDLAVVATPAAAVLDVLRDAHRAGIANAVVLAAGFGETGDRGRDLALQVAEAVRRDGIRFIGPNCFGLMRPGIGLNATFGRTPARAGPIALVSQSGAICSALVDWAWPAGIGFSAVVSMGDAIDLDIGEILDYLQYDHDTRSILLYLEGVRDARRFVSGLRACARSKPIVVVKVGRHLSGRKAALSHTGALAGSDAAFDAVLRRCGAVRVRTYPELFAATRLLAAERVPAGNRLAILTNGGGPGVLAADACADEGVLLARFGESTRSALDRLLPRNAARGNPVDLLGDADLERFTGALAALIGDPEVDGVLTLFCPQRVTGAAETAAAMLPIIQKATKPVLTGWLGQQDAQSGRAAIENAGLPAFASPEAAVAAFGTLARYRHAQALLLEAPPPLTRAAQPDLDGARALLAAAEAAGRRQLTEPEAKRLLECFGIPTTRTVVAATAAAAARAAATIGYPVVLKIVSPDIGHKSDVDGVRLNIRDPEALEREFGGIVERARAARPEARIEGVAVQPMVRRRFGREVLAGLSIDTVFGPVISVGTGGIAVELLADIAVGLPPLSKALAEAMIDSTRMARLLAAYRHIPAARREAIVEVLLRISDIAVSLPEVSELEINPLLVDEEGAIALDARVVFDLERGPPDPHYTHMAIHPYPVRLEGDLVLRDGTRLRVRPIRPEDAQIELEFVGALSDQSRYLRFFSPTQRLSPRMLARLTQVDYDRELALVALEGSGGTERMAAVARFVPLAERESCEFAVTVADRWHGHGLGHLMMQRLIAASRESGYTRMTGQILAVNAPMLALARNLGFRLSANRDDMSIVDAELPLG